MQALYTTLLILLLCNASVLLTESTDITFSGFTAGTVYTYYTNEDNPITELNCSGSSTDTGVTSISTTWYYRVSEIVNTDTGSSVLRFEDVATVVKWREYRVYFCRTVYDINGQERQQDSGDVFVDIKYNTTITVSYGDTVYVRDITNRDTVRIPVMTESVTISCDAEGGEWTHDGQSGIDNPVRIDLFTIANAEYYDCTKKETPTEPNRIIHSVEVKAVGSGIWLQKQDTYTELSEAETVVLTENRILVCVTSSGYLYTAWHYRGDTNTGLGERVLDTESDQLKGFLKLNLPQSLPANRTGYYYCNTSEYVDTGNTQYKEHSVNISLSAASTTATPPTTTTPPPTTTTTTTTTTPTTTTLTASTTPTTRTTPTATTATPPPTTPTPSTTTTTTATTTATTATSPRPTTLTTTTTTLTTTTTSTEGTPESTPLPISLQLYYTPNYRVVFVGVDDVTLVCVASSDSGTMINVSLLDTQTGSILKSQSSSEAEIKLEQRVKLRKGDLPFKCSVATETGQREEQSVSIRAEDPYIQEILNLRTDTYSGEVLLKWDTSHPPLANETFTIWIYSLNGTGVSPRTGTTRSREYPLSGLSWSLQYALQVQVLSRLGGYNSSLLYYIHTDSDTAFPIYAVGGLVAGLFLVLVLAAGVLVLVVCLLIQRRKNGFTKYSRQTETGNRPEPEPEPESETETDTGTEPGPGTTSHYTYLSDIGTSPASDYVILPSNTSKKVVYKKLPQSDTTMTSPLENPSEASGVYMYLDPLEPDLDPNRRETDSGMEDVGSQNGEVQYENVRDTLYLSTGKKYAKDPHATLVPLCQYKDHLSHLLSDNNFEKEYRALGGQDLRGECTSAMLTENKNKNKYKMIYPYDSSRVALARPLDTDYINASFVPGFHLIDTFIAAQAPKTTTTGDFWQLILEQRVSTIVMLTRLVELGKEKCAGYWPASPGASARFGPNTVTLHKVEEYAGYCVRELVLSLSDNKKIKVTQFHYTAWPDHDVPLLYNNLLEFTQTVKEHRKQELTPFLVHCSAGVGRSGTFISLYNLLEAVSAGDPISVYRIVNEMREHRPQMVQTSNQYRFIYLSVLELIFGSTAIPSDDFCENYKLYQQSQGDTDTDIFKQQFQELSYQSDCSFNYPQTAAREPSNEDKNVDRDVLPYDVNRVILSSQNWPCEYINASYMEGYELVATPLPTSDTILDFLQLVYQMEDPLVVLLLSQTEYQGAQKGTSDSVCYWREDKGLTEFDGFSVTTETSQKSSFLLQQKMKVLSSFDKDERPFSQFISLAWKDTGGLENVVGVVTLLNLILKHKKASPGKKILFCCSDGIGKSGVMLTVYTAVRRMEQSRSIDVFQTVKQMRNARKNMVPTIEHYLSCYQLINEYCQRTV